MSKIGARHPMKQAALLGYGVAVLSVGVAVTVLWVIPARWQPAAQVSMLLIAVIITARFGGAAAGLLAGARPAGFQLPPTSATGLQ